MARTRPPAGCRARTWAPVWTVTRSLTPSVKAWEVSTRCWRPGRVSSGTAPQSGVSASRLGSPARCLPCPTYLLTASAPGPAGAHREADRGCQHDRYKEVAETIRTVFAQSAADVVRTQLDTAADMLGTQFPKVRTMLLEAEDDLTAFAGFPERRRAKTLSTNSPERINREVKRRTGVVQVFLNDGAVLWLITAVLFELHDEWIAFLRYLPEGGMDQLYPAELVESAPRCPAPPTQRPINGLHQGKGRDPTGRSWTGMSHTVRRWCPCTLDAGVRHTGHGTAASWVRAVITILSPLSATSSTVSSERPEIAVPV
ncbi:transposase [Streptomyces sp. NPDC006855]|uniref:transposase n=1 Tax=Streptomyces sp. NPDC006855 TaxID=3364765 RepID=UPI0036906280